jgi:hypothetical protein
MHEKDDQEHAIIRNLMAEATHGPLAAEATNGANVQTVGCLNEIVD